MAEIRCPITREVIQTAQYFNNNESRFLTEFEEIKVLGEGSFGVVVSSKNRIDKKTYAVKKVKIGQFPDFDYNRVIREVEIMALLDHDNIVQYHMAWLEPDLVGISFDVSDDVSDDDDESGAPVSCADSPCLYILLEQCDGKRMDEDRIFSEKDCWSIFEDIVRGLIYIHGLQIMHGDLSPGNVFHHGGVWKIGDFGIACYLDGQDHMIHEDDKFGLYKAPDEMLAAAVDIYSAGMLLFAMLLQTRPITEMERTKEIEALKNARIKMLPDDWDDFPHRRLVLQLVTDIPDERPSLEAVLGTVQDAYILL
ncbi:unnamed protein product [Prunus brigantina]